MTNNTITTIDLLRHGEPEGGPKYRGALDEPLSERGWGQLHTAVGAHPPWERVVSSPLKRCAEFAQALGQQHGIGVEIESDFREMRFGDWEGRTAAAVMAATPEAVQRFWRDPLAYPPPGGEPLQEWAAKVTAAWQALLARHQGRHVLVLSHGGTMRVILCHLLDMPLRRLWRLDIPYATLSRVRLYGSDEGTEPMLVFHGKTTL